VRRGTAQDLTSTSEEAAEGDASRPAAAPPFMSVKQAAAYLQINEKKVYALASEGILPGTKATGKWLFPRVLVDQWLLESTHGGVLTDRLVLAGGGDPLLERAVQHVAADSQARALVAYTATGTQLGLSLLAARRVDAAGLHWGPAEESHYRHAALLSSFAQHREWVLVRLCQREQGVMLARSLDPERTAGAGLFAADLRWVLRSEGAGSQRFLAEAAARHEAQLERLHVVRRSLSAQDAAARLALGEAEAAPGTRAVAREFGLGFVATGWEAFDLALHRGIYFRALFQKLLDELKSERIQELARALGGYRFDELGRLVWNE